MSTLTFADTHNMVAFLEKPAESDGFHEIIDFLNANQIRYALTVNPTIYTSCIEQFWATAKAKMVNGERQIQDHNDMKKVDLMETSIRVTYLEDARSFFSPQWKFLIHTITQCLSAKSTAWNEFSSTMASLIICLATNQKFNLSKYIFDAMVKHLDGGVKFLMYPRFLQVFINQQLGDMSHHKKIYVNPSHTKKIFANMRREGKDFSGRITPLFETMMVQANQEEGVDSGIPTDSQQTPITTQPSSSRSQKKQSRRKQRKDTAVTQEETQQDDSVPTPSNDPPLSGEDSMQLSELMLLCTNLQKQGRSIEDIDKDADVSLVDDNHGRSDDAEMFDTNDLHGDEVVVDMPVGEKQEHIFKLKQPKPKVVTTAATTTTTRPKARGVVVQEPSEFRTPQASQPLKIKEKAQLEVKLIEEERLARKKEEEANIALIESWDNTQAMMEADFELAQRLQTEEQGEITIEERSRLFVELMNKRKKHFAMLRAEEKRRKPPTKAQKRNLMSTYLKNMGGYKHNQLKSKSYEEIQKLFDNEMRRVNTFIPMDSEVVKSKKGTEESSKGTEDELESDKSKKAESSEEKAKGSRKKILGKKRAGKEQQQESSKRQRMEDDKETDEHEEVEVDDEAELKMHMVIVKDDDIAVDAIPLATKPPVIVEYKIIKEGIIGHYQLIRADGSSKRYSSMIRMLQGIDREDLETLWKLVKTKHGDTRPEDEHERVLWGDLKVMFEPDIKSDVWRNLQGYKVTIWKLYDSCGVHFVRFGNVHIFMLVEKRYPLTPITITNMLNKKLQADYWNEMCYQLLKLMVKQQKGQ
ncbi:hypothetical protein Tco_0010941 [Tanacetum coccineum]